MSQNATNQPTSTTSTSSSTQNPYQPRHTPAEKAWLKENWKDEFHFLASHGLSIYKDEDRQEGKAILKGLMDEEALREADDEEDDGYESNDFLRELEEDPMSHVADYHFPEAQLDFIKKHYKHSGNFMLSMGLKPFDDEDCAEAKQIVQGFMEDEK